MFSVLNPFILFLDKYPTLLKGISLTNHRNYVYYFQGLIVISNYFFFTLSTNL